MVYRSLSRGHSQWLKSLPAIFIVFLIPCWLGAINCTTHISMGLGPDCTLEITPAALITDAGVDPNDVTLVLTYGGGIVIRDNVLRLKHVGRAIKAQLICNGPSCGSGTCWTNIELKKEVLPEFGQMLDTAVYCFDSLIFMDPSADDYPITPAVTSTCSSFSGPFFAADWIDVHVCEEESDTAKFIYREWYALSKEGRRVVSFDTIAVLRLPPISMAVHCPSSDTTYCEDGHLAFGPYLLIETVAGECDTIYLLELEELLQKGLKCDLRIKVEKSPFETDCGEVSSYEIELVQTCSRETTTCVGEELIEANPIGGGVFASCRFWHMVLDTLPPEIQCLDGKDTISLGDTIVTVVSATSQDCSAHILPPDAIVHDICSDARYVKARIDTLGTVIYENVGDSLWRAQDRVRLPYQPGPYEVIIEAYDSCHNRAADTCYIIIKDRTRPTVVAHDTLNVTVDDEKIWLNYESFDNGSSDNCSGLRYFVRRADWTSFCVNPCDQIERLPTVVPGDSVNCALLTGTEPDQIESHYQEYLEWLRNDGDVCNELLAAAWQYDLCRAVQVECLGAVDASAFADFYAEKFGINQVEALAQLGGGWTESVPIGPTDKSTSVVVEMLVMDYWCNWSVSWSQVFVKERIITRSVADRVAGKQPHTLFRQAYPNPFRNISMINVELSSSTSVQVTITGIDGREVFETRKTYPAGLHPIAIRREDLAGSGIYYYRVITAQGQQTSGKLILLE